MRRVIDEIENCSTETEDTAEIKEAQFLEHSVVVAYDSEVKIPTVADRADSYK